MTPTTKKVKKEQRLEQIEKRLVELREQYGTAKAKREADRRLLTRGKEIKEQIQYLQHEAERAQMQTDYTKVAEITHGQIPVLEQELIDVESQFAEAQESGRLSLNDSVQAEDIAGIISRRTGIPATKLIQSEAEKLTHLENHLSKRVIGQDHAVKIVANAVRRSKAGLQDQQRPLASFLFLGPTGVGKTELAKTLAEFLFDDEQAMIRLDMSEYAESHTVAKLIGSPPGYIGHEEGGQLTEAVRRKPYSVILFDEVEKAHPDVFNTLLQLLDDGRLTDSKGRTVNFKNTVIIMTSNLAQSAQDDAEMMQELQNYFRPEFLNRLDDIIRFNSISKEVLMSILEVQLQKLATHLKYDKDITLFVSESAKDHLATVGYDPLFGARPLKRALQQELLDELAMGLLDGSLKEGREVSVEVENGTIIVK